jgi:hypothetical protein
MDRLSILLTLATGAVITGSLVVIAFTLGYYGWGAVLTAAVVGVLASWPAAYAISRRIKRDDPGFDHTRARPGPLPDPGGREV